MAIDPEIGFTADVIKDPSRFVGRTSLIQDCISAINSKSGLISVFGKRGVGKSSLLRQIQQMALGDYTLAKRAGLSHLIPSKPRKYLTVYYSCDSLISDGKDLLTRLCNDQSEEDSLLRLVPNDGKEITEFSRSKEVSGGADLKVVNWGAKGVETSKYARIVPNDIVQTFRNYIDSVVMHQVQKRMKRDGLLIILDEFDVIQNKDGLGSLIKSLTSAEVKFAVCGIGRDLTDLIHDHASVERLIEQGVLSVTPMPQAESEAIVHRAAELFSGSLRFSTGIPARIAEIGQGYPYFVQLIGKQCVIQANTLNTTIVDDKIVDKVLDDLKSGKAFPTLESAYQRAIGNSKDRQILLHLLAEQDSDETLFTDEIGRVILKDSRQAAEGFDIQYVDQLIPRLVEKRYGPVLERVPERQGVYEFVNPVLRQYIKLRKLEN
ncbi:AAA family ATPase [Burkholderia multivorans]|uniref:nSTAND1 domain-containing NTPase n=1 Tax=Burkholderia multivorans TaxID=87883 RepID=UPI0020A5B2C7|nr:AAA family ATPase [Burkholderia multivorans]MCO8579468.1 AAA family ATPase [Burkholderia multivorans]